MPRIRIPLTQDGSATDAPGRMVLERGSAVLRTPQITFAGFRVLHFSLEQHGDGRATIEPRGALVGGVSWDGGPMTLHPNDVAEIVIDVTEPGHFSAWIECESITTTEAEPEPAPFASMRIPRGLYEVLSAAAQENRQSVQSYVADVLTGHIGDGEPAALALLGVDRGRVVLALRNLARALEPEAQPVLVAMRPDGDERTGFAVLHPSDPPGAVPFALAFAMQPIPWLALRVLGFEVETSGGPCVVTMTDGNVNGDINLLHSDQVLAFEPADPDVPNVRRISSLRANPTVQPGNGATVGLSVVPSGAAPVTVIVRLIAQAAPEPHLTPGYGGPPYGPGHPANRY